MLTHGAVRYARLAVLVQDKLVRALALVRGDSRLAIPFEQIRASGRCNETEMRAAAVVLRAGIVVGQLSKGVIGMNVVGPMGGIAQHLQVRAGEFLRPANGLQVPVGPVNEVVEHGDGEHVWHRGARQDNSPIVTVEIGEGDVIQMGVGPEDTIGEVIDSQSVRPGDIVLPRQNLGEVTAVHAHLTDICLEHGFIKPSLILPTVQLFARKLMRNPPGGAKT